MADFLKIFDAISVPVVGLDCNLQLVAENREAVKAFSSSGKPNKISAAISKKRRLRKLLQNTLETGAKNKTSILVKGKFNTEFQASITAVAPADQVNDIALIMTFEDRSSALETKAMRSNFVANVSHEIRSPLTAISGFVETLQGSARDDPDAQKMFLKLMGKEVTRMTNLVSELLSLSRVEVKERRAPKKTADLSLIIQQAHEMALVFAKKHGKSVVVHSAPDLPVIYGSSDDLTRVLINLLENAVTYSRDGGEIRLTAVLDSGPNPLGKVALKISVHDQGEGIPAVEIPRLTERFYRVDKSRSRNAGGTGLGLAIVKHILVRHRGKLVIKSALGQGSEFQIYLPVPKLAK